MKPLSLVLVACLISAFHPLRAQQPFVTDDAGVTATGRAHFESFDEYDWLARDRTPHLRQNTINGKLNFGVANGFELDVDAPLITIYNDATSVPRQPFGLGDTEFGVKWNFRGSADDTTAGSSAFATVLYIEVPTGNVANNLGSGLTDTWFYFVAQRTFAAQTVLHGNIGYLVTGNPATGAIGLTANGHVATASASLTRQVSDAVLVGVELAGAAADSRAQDHTQLQAMFGATYSLRDNLSVALGLIAGHFAAAPLRGLQIGFAWDQ